MGEDPPADEAKGGIRRFRCLGVTAINYGDQIGRAVHPIVPVWTGVN